MFGNFCQNWFGKISKHHEFISMTKLDTFNVNMHHILSPVAKVQSCQTFNQNLVLLFVFSFSYFVKANFGAFVCIFI
jgi:hypothetical protein